jgi:hypothetical protein
MIIGSSNVRRFYSHSRYSDYQPYKMELCTVFRMFEVTMESIPADARVIVSVIENFIEKEISQEGEKDGQLKNVMKRFMDVLVKTAKKNEKARLVVAYPILRPGSKWMTDNEEKIRKEFESAYNEQDQLNISKVDCMLKSSQVFDKDGVHLTQKAGATFVENLLGMAEDNFEADIVDLGDKDIDIVDKIQTAATSSKKEAGGVAINELKRSVMEMREWRDNFTQNINKKFINDNLMFARMREELDAEINRKKEDRTLVAGCVDPTLMPTAGKDRNIYLKQLAADFCKKLDPSFDAEVQFASVSGRPDKGNLMLEFKLDSADKAREIRKNFAQKRIANTLPESFGKLQVMTVITQATKVRFEIMKAIARQVETDKEVGYVPTYLPRPILHIKGKEVTGPRKHIRSLTFTDAIEQYGRRVEAGDLRTAYDKAAWNFQGQMRQHFVVLMDKDELSRGSGYSGPSRGAWRGRGGRGSPSTDRGRSTGGARGGGTKRASDESVPEGKFQKKQ